VITLKQDISILQAGIVANRMQALALGKLPEDAL
jgi:hypothetical protein